MAGKPLIAFFLVMAMALAGGAAAQWNTVQVLVLDSTDQQPIPEVAITVNGRDQGSTDGEGKARLRWQGAPDARLRFTHVSYAPRGLKLPPTGAPPGIMRVYLVQRDLLLESVSVGRQVPEVVFSRPDLHAADLLINDAGLWVLAYEHPRMLRSEGEAGREILREVRLVLLDTLFREVASCPVPEDVFGLRHDLRYDVVIEGTRHAFSVGRAGDELVLHPFGLDELRHAVLPWTDSIPGWVVGSNASADFPAFDHLAFDPLRDSTRRICSVVDTFMMDLFRSSYKYLKGPDKVLAMNLAGELGVDKEIVAGYMSGFSRNIWFKPLYAPLFVVGDTLLVFDHAKGMMRKFTRAFEERGDVPLAYTGKKNGRHWAGRLVQDRATQQVYAVFRHFGTTWLQSIDAVNGTLGRPFSITGEYPEQVQVHTGKVYYIWRPYGSLQKRTIYREQL
jgi:hypothetical protein